MFDIMSTRGAKFELRPIYAQVDGDYQRGSTGVCVCGFSLHLNFKAPPPFQGDHIVQECHICCYASPPVKLMLSSYELMC